MVKHIKASAGAIPGRRAAGMVARLAAVTLTFALFTVATMALVPSSASAATNVQICFAIDASGSIEPDEFWREKDGIASAIEDDSLVPHDGSVEVTAIVFATTAKTVLPPTVISDSSTAASVALTIRDANRDGIDILTNIAAAIELCTSEVTGSPEFGAAGNQAINIATNGQKTTGGNPVDARIAAVAAGIDRLDAEAIQSPANVDLLMDMVWPQPAEKVTPPGVPSGDTGFVLNVDSFEQFGPAIEIKIPAVIPTPPTPVTPEPTVTPGPIGGVGVFPQVSDGPAGTTGSPGGGTDVALAALTAVAGVAAIGGGLAFCTRRRWFSG